MEQGYVSEIISSILDPQSIYKHFMYLSGLIAFFPWLYVIAVTVRIFRESVASLSFKAALHEAIADINKTLLLTIAYSSAGTILFALLFGMSNLFHGFGSTHMIHVNMLELRQTLISSPAQATDWFGKLLNVVASYATFGPAIIIWVVYQIGTVAYVFLSQLIDVLFALGVVLLYAWGFVAMPSMMLGPGFSMVNGWVKTLTTFFVWVIVEPILLGVVWMLSSGARDFITAHYAGLGFTSTAIWYLYAIVIMFMVIVVKVLSPFVAVMLAKNESFVSSLAGAAAVPAAIALNQIVGAAVKTGTDEESGLRRGLGSMMPNSDGMRRRDMFSRVMDKAGDIANTPISDLVRRNVRSGLGDSTDTTPPPNPSGGGDNTTNMSGSGAGANESIDANQSPTAGNNPSTQNADRPVSGAQTEGPLNSNNAESNSNAPARDVGQGDAPKNDSTSDTPPETPNKP